MGQYSLFCLLLLAVFYSANAVPQYLFTGYADLLAPQEVEADPIVHTEHGSIRGSVMKTRLENAIYAYRGIPYAKPPVGDLRFKAPVPTDAWRGVLDATRNGPICIQKTYLYANPKVTGQEDCLYLNVYSRVYTSPNTIERKNPLPVLAYIHGGGFFYGNGGSGEEGPEYLLDRDVILVTMNYRLGALGFLSTEDDVALGNWAFKDQILALKWIQKNIHRFGGDPNSVTIFGQSAGSASVHYLMLSPIAKGLFHKAICQSGSAINLWSVPYNSLEIARTQASFVNCTDTDNAKMIECLRKVDATDLVISGDRFKLWNLDPLVIFRPTVEAKTKSNPNPFLPDDPVTLMKTGQFNQVPFMIGVMKNEGILRGGPLVADASQREEFNEKWDTLGPVVFGLELSTQKEKVPELWKNISSFYMTNNKIDKNDPESIQNFINMYGDRGFIYDVYRAINYYVKFSKAPTYFYKFDYEVQQSYSRLFIPSNDLINYKFNSSHCDDLLLQFTVCDLGFYPILPHDIDYKMSVLWVDFITNLAKFGTPAMFWEPTDITRMNFLLIEGPSDNYFSNIKLSIEDNFLSDRMNFWKSLDIFENK